MRKALVLLVSALAVGVTYVVEVDAVSLGGGDGSYAFLRHQQGDHSRPVTYSSCKPIPVEINLEGVRRPEVVKDIVLAAMGEVSAASGLQLQYVGPTSRRPRWPDETLTVMGGAWPVLVGFVTSVEQPLLDGHAGVGGSSTVTRSEVETYVTGQVALERNYFNALLNRYHGPQTAKAIVMHELGHVLGLGHVQDNHEVMDGDGGTQFELGPGDRRGLALLGEGPCV